MEGIKFEYLVILLQVNNTKTKINLNSSAKLNSNEQLFLTFFHVTDAPKIRYYTGQDRMKNCSKKANDIFILTSA